MRLLTGTFFAFLLVACSSAPPAPDVPVLKTKAGKACVEHCENEHSECSDGCSLIIGATSGPRRQRGNCEADCVRVVQACYARCQSETPGTSAK